MLKIINMATMWKLRVICDKFNAVRIY